MMHKAPHREQKVQILIIEGKIISKTLRKLIKYAEDGGESTSLKHCSVTLMDEQTELRKLKGQVIVEQGTENNPAPPNRGTSKEQIQNN